MKWGISVGLALTVLGCQAVAPGLAGPYRVAAAGTEAPAGLSVDHLALMGKRVTTTAVNPVIPRVEDGSLVLGGRPFDGGGATLSEIPGRQGTPAELIQAVVEPLVSAWAADASLVRAYRYPARGYFDGGVPASWTASELAIVHTFGWPLAYRSAARGEILLIYVAADTTLVVRVRDGQATE